jgi:hypothetical protein
MQRPTRFTTNQDTSMHKKTQRKIKLARETILIVSGDNLQNVAGGLTATPTCSLQNTTGPFPSHGPCGGSVI